MTAPDLYEQDNMMILVGEFYLSIQKHDIPFKRLEEILGYFSKLEEEYPVMDPEVRKVVSCMGADLVRVKHEYKYL